MRTRELALCNQQITFLKGLFHERMRVDRRQWTQRREIDIEFNPRTGVTIARLGDTKVLCCIEAEVATPRRTGRPGAGSIQFQMEVLPMASSGSAGGETATDPEVEECLTMLETLYRDSYCIDFDTLCIEMDRYVVDLKCSLKVLDHDGGLLDCCSLAVTATLAGFRRNDVTYDAINKRIVVHPPSDRPMLPLTLYHKPVTVTFGFVDGILEPMVDPTGGEDPLITGYLTIGANHRSEVCMVHQTGNICIGPGMIFKCSEYAIDRAEETLKLVERATARPKG